MVGFWLELIRVGCTVTGRFTAEENVRAFFYTQRHEGRIFRASTWHYPSQGYLSKVRDHQNRSDGPMPEK